MIVFTSLSGHSPRFFVRFDPEQPAPKICLKAGNCQKAEQRSPQPHLAKPAENKRRHAEQNAKKAYSAAGRSCASGRVGGRTMDDRQSRKLRQLQAEMIALANDREKATSAEACRAIDAKLRALAERGAAMKHVKMSPEEKPCAACKRPTARTVVSEGRAHRFCSVECASSGVQRSCDGVASMASRWTYRFDAVGDARRWRTGVVLMRWSTPSVSASTPSTDGSSRAGAGRNKSKRDAGQRRGWSQTDGSAGEAPPPRREPIGRFRRTASMAWAPEI